MGRNRFGKRQNLRRKKVVRRKNKQVLVNRALQPIPQRYIVKMKYSDVLAVSGTGQYAMNLNSIFDPDRTGVGHQPYGRDTFETLYNRYRVISCGYRLQALIPETSSPRNMAAVPGNDIIPFSNIGYVRENPRAKYVVQAPSAPCVTLSGKCYIPSLVGRSKSQYMADDRFQADMGSNPAELAILNIYVADSTGVAISTNVQITLEYTVEFFDVKHLGQS